MAPCKPHTYYDTFVTYSRMFAGSNAFANAERLLLNWESLLKKNGGTSSNEMAEAIRNECLNAPGALTMRLNIESDQFLSLFRVRCTRLRNAIRINRGASYGSNEILERNQRSTPLMEQESHHFNSQGVFCSLCIRVNKRPLVSGKAIFSSTAAV